MFCKRCVCVCLCVGGGGESAIPVHWRIWGLISPFVFLLRPMGARELWSGAVVGSCGRGCGGVLWSGAAVKGCAGGLW